MKYLLFFFLIWISFLTFADIPGNKPRATYEVKISGLKNYSNYTFYVSDERNSKELKEGSNIRVPGGYGEPQCEQFWAINKITNKNTDTIYFCSGEERQSISVIVHIFDNHLSYEANTGGVRKENIPLSFGNNIDDNHVKNTRIMYLVSGISFLVLLGLVFMVWNKNRKFNHFKRQLS